MNSRTRAPSKSSPTDRGDGGDPSARAVECEKLPEIHVADAVSVGQHERLILEPRLQALEAATGERVLPGVDEMDGPVLDLLAVLGDLAAGEIYRDTGAQHLVVEEVPLDALALVAQSADELGEAMVLVVLHDVPEDRLAADLHHWLRPERRLLGEPCAESTRENHDLHRR